MSNQEDDRCSSRYGLLGSVPRASCGSVFYHGPCPRASASRAGICLDSAFSRCRLPENRGGRCAHVCCDADCLVAVTKSAEDEDDCRCRCRCCRRDDDDILGRVCNERACRIRCRREDGDEGEDRGDFDCCSRRCRCRDQRDAVEDEENGCGRCRANTEENAGAGQ